LVTSSGESKPLIATATLTVTPDGSNEPEAVEPADARGVGALVPDGTLAVGVGTTHPARVDGEADGEQAPTIATETSVTIRRTAARYIGGC
jgi:hypothetical protein